MDATRMLQRVIDSRYRLAALETTEGDRILGVFKRLTLTTGRAVYHWTPENGLYRLGIEHIFIPRTRAPADVLSYIAASRHYGIYLLYGFNNALTKASLQRQLSTINSADDNVRRLVIMVGEQVDIPQTLRKDVAMIRHNVRPRVAQAGA
ncbi:MAG: hypothetical protein PVH31_00435 [Ectothiorhodospiraceae bacterium]|jgi:hypothetical protein